MAATNGTASWATWLKRHREDQGWSQTELARRAHVPKDRISKWEMGKEQPRIDGIRAVCLALQVPAGKAMVEAGLLDPTDIAGATVVHRLDPATLTKRELLAELDRRIPPDAASGDHLTPPTPIRKRRDQPLLIPEGEEGRDWVAWEPDES